MSSEEDDKNDRMHILYATSLKLIVAQFIEPKAAHQCDEKPVTVEEGLSPPVLKMTRETAPSEGLIVVLALHVAAEGQRALARKSSRSGTTSKRRGRPSKKEAALRAFRSDLQSGTVKRVRSKEAHAIYKSLRDSNAPSKATIEGYLKRYYEKMDWTGDRLNNSDEIVAMVDRDLEAMGADRAT